MRNRLSSSAFSIFVLSAIAIGVSTAGPVGAQRRGRARNIPFSGTVVEWTLFVSPHGAVPTHRAPIAATPGEVPLPGTSYRCSYGAPSRVAVDGTNWSETRTLECRFGSTIVSSSGFCQVSGASWGPRAAVLYLQEEGQDERIQVSLDCTVRPPS